VRVICVLLSLSSALSAASIDFSRDIQPILSDKCYFCHGPDAKERKGDLRLDVEKEAKAVKDGVAAILPGKSHESSLIERIFSTDLDEVMPTPKSHRTLTDTQKQLLKQWIDEGAKWGKHWAFERIERLKVPDVGAKNPIDAFVRAKLAEKGMKPSPKADAMTLLRRVSLDLTGLPPSADQLKGDYAKTVARLLDSPRFGERWAWDWLDAARYADTNGYQGDPERTMWPWRDWVVKVINANMPYDQFTIWQLGGDLLPNATQEQVLATGFNRNHMINGEGGRIAEETRVENVMDRVETTSTVWLGLTMGCSKCHDHKFDPLTMRDYYGLYDVFNQTSEDGMGRSGQAIPALDLATADEKTRFETASAAFRAIVKDINGYETTRFGQPPGEARTKVALVAGYPGKLTQFLGRQAPDKRSADNLLECIAQLRKLNDKDYADRLQRLLKALKARTAAQGNVTKVMVMDTGPKVRETFVLEKGAYDKPTTTKVSFHVPASLPTMKQDAPRNRLGLAEWIVSRDNPLTARVTVNRFWQAFFGIGLVKTAEDFGLQGEEPPQRELLDWLAAEFIESGWDVKALMRLIVTSETYQQSSKIADAQVDPENRWLARGPRFRMPSWMLRDQALFVSGLLKDQLGGPSVKPYQPEGIWEEATFGKKSYVQDHGDALYRRTLYIFWRRIVGPTMLFDNAARQTCVIKATRTNTPLQALVTLNDVTYVEAARALAQRVLLANRGQEKAALAQAFRCVTCRDPSKAEAALLKEQLGKLRAQLSGDRGAAMKLMAVGESKRDESIDVAEHATWTSLCLMMLNLDEAVTKE
jgi:uncharacterized protein DUF1553/uncharacterized protein DUF1549/cytochrome c